jgi:hypothetical protein
MRGGPTAPMLAAMNANPISISLELRLEDDSFAGRAETDSGQARDFTGWLGLMGAIEALLDSERPEEDQ